MHFRGSILSCLQLMIALGTLVSAPLYAGGTKLILNAPYRIEVPKEGGFPRKWRTSADLIQKHTPENPDRTGPDRAGPDRTGMESLRAAGSAMFSEGQFETLKEFFQGKTVDVIDLRRESHGFIDHMAVSWFAKENLSNLENTPEEIDEKERTLLQTLLRAKAAKVWQFSHLLMDGNLTKGNLESSPFWRSVTAVKTEAELVTRHGFNYVRVPVSDHHSPLPAQVDQFIRLYKATRGDPRHWFYFHCAGGEGRTTTFMVLYDMLVNAPRVSANDIIARQTLLGGSDLQDLKKPTESRHLWAIDRLKFVYQFYEYARSQGPDFEVSWSQWLVELPPTPPPTSAEQAQLRNSSGPQRSAPDRLSNPGTESPNPKDGS